jgi:hypothetical protein
MYSPLRIFEVGHGNGPLLVRPVADSPLHQVLKTLFQVGGKLVVLCLVAHFSTSLAVRLSHDFTVKWKLTIALAQAPDNQENQAFSYGGAAADPTSGRRAASYDSLLAKPYEGGQR